MTNHMEKSYKTVQKPAPARYPSAALSIYTWSNADKLGAVGVFDSATVGFRRGALWVDIRSTFLHKGTVAAADAPTQFGKC